jgi:hypothetical protein
LRVLGRLAGKESEVAVQPPAVAPGNLLGEAMKLLRDATHRFESVRLLRAAATWQDLELPKLVEAVARDGAVRTASITDGSVTRFLSDFRDLFCEYDNCTRRTSAALEAVGGGKDERAVILAALGDLRVKLLQAFAGGVANIRDQLAVLPGEESTTLHKYIQRLADRPEDITNFSPEVIQQ